MTLLILSGLVPKRCSTSVWHTGGTDPGFESKNKKKKNLDRFPGWNNTFYRDNIIKGLMRLGEVKMHPKGVVKLNSQAALPQPDIAGRQYT